MRPGRKLPPFEDAHVVLHSGHHRRTDSPPTSAGPVCRCRRPGWRDWLQRRSQSTSRRNAAVRNSRTDGGSHRPADGVKQCHNIRHLRNLANGFHCCQSNCTAGMQHPFWPHFPWPHPSAVPLFQAHARAHRSNLIGPCVNTRCHSGHGSLAPLPDRRGARLAAAQRRVLPQKSFSETRKPTLTIPTRTSYSRRGNPWSSKKPSKSDVLR